MAWRIPLSTSTVGIAINLNFEEDAFVAKGVVIASSNAQAIVGSDGGHEVIVAGSVLSGEQGNGVQLGTDAAVDLNNRVVVEARHRQRTLTEPHIFSRGCGCSRL